MASQPGAVLVGNGTDCIVAEAERLRADTAAYAEMARAHNPFGDGYTAARIVELLASEISGDRITGGS
jgi:UDP-N-acetylglucosamine 2-epimerase (non-hydrolysing)